MSRWRTLAALALGTIFAAAAGYWFTIGRRPLEDAGLGEEEVPAS